MGCQSPHFQDIPNLHENFIAADSLGSMDGKATLSLPPTESREESPIINYECSPSLKFWGSRRKWDGGGGV